MLLLNQIILVVFILLVINHSKAENGVEWVHEYRSDLNDQHTVTIEQVRTEYKEEWIKKGHCYYYAIGDSQRYHIYNDDHIENNLIQFNCQWFISFNEEVGIYTCQNNDKAYILLSSADVQLNQPSVHYTTKCESLTGIIKGENVMISCEVKPFQQNIIEQEIITGWIQEEYTTQTTHMDSKEGHLHFTQSITAVHSGDGVFFYCFTSKYQHYDCASPERIKNLCYTFVLKVHPQLGEKDEISHETPENVDDKHCFICHAVGRYGDKIYSRTLNDEKLTNNNNNHKRCFNKLPAGNNTFLCLVNIEGQEISDCIELTAKDVMQTDTRTATQPSTRQQDNQVHTQNKETKHYTYGKPKEKISSSWPVTSQINNKVHQNKVNETKECSGHKVVIMILTATTSLLLFAVLILIYLLKMKCYMHPQSEGRNQRGNEMSVHGPSDIPQISEDNEMYYTIWEAAEHAENHYVIPKTVNERKSNADAYNREINEIIVNEERNNHDITDTTEGEKLGIQNGNRTDGEIPFYFVLESNLPGN